MHRLVRHGRIVNRGDRLALERIESLAAGLMTCTPPVSSTFTNLLCTAFTPSIKPASPFFSA